MQLERKCSPEFYGPGIKHFCKKHYRYLSLKSRYYFIAEQLKIIFDKKVHEPMAPHNTPSFENVFSTQWVYKLK